ncbi:MAG: DNA repair protein RecN [Nitrospinota bacterium]
MLTALRVQNFALIEQLSVEFGPGLTVLTGETGAGKSIIFGALQLILGGRANADLIRAGAKEATVEALFHLPRKGPGGTVRERLRGMGIDADEGEMALRRIVSAEGRNRCFVNASPVTLAMLESAGEFLIDVHGQHQHQRLLYPENHLEILDDFGSLRGRRDGVARMIRKLRELEARRGELSRQETDQRDRVDLLQFQLREINAADPIPGEEEALEAEAALLASAEERHSLARGAHEEMYESEGSLVDGLASVAGRVDRLAELDPALRDLAEEVRSLNLRAGEAARRVRQYADGVEFDPGRQRAVEERLDVLRSLKRKYGGSVEEILAYRGRAARELEELSNRDLALEEVCRAVEELRPRVAEEALKFSGERQAAAARLGGAVQKELRGLGMEKVRITVDVQDEEDTEGFVQRDGRRLRLFEDGVDKAEFQFEPNVGEGVRPLARIVSGGELSRLMLAIKTVLADRDRVPSLLFDEIDVGIGGAVAEVVGKKLKAISRSHQVFCITHLPQIAALADAHFVISKEEKKSRTRTTIRPLSQEERVEELARMAGGKKITAATRRHAAEMLGLK